MLSLCEFSFRMGGILPPIAGALHQQNIEQVVDDAMKDANMELKVIILSVIIIPLLDS